MGERKTRTLVYKSARFLKQGKTLRSLLAEALDKAATVKERRESIARKGDSPMWRIIGLRKVEQEFVFGVLMRYMPGLNAAFVVDDEDADSLTLEQLAAPITDEGKRRELLEAMLFFGVIDNHVVLMQSSALRARHLEAHLRWFLHNSQVLEGTNTLELQDQLPKKTRERLEQRPVSKLIIGGGFSVHRSDLLGSAKGERNESTTVSDAAETPPIAAALRTLLGPARAAALGTSLEEGGVRYTLTLTPPPRVGDAQGIIKSFGSAFRNVEGLDTTIVLAKGGTIRGDDLRLSGDVRIETYGGIPSADEVFEVMRKWLLETVDGGEVRN